MKANFLAEAFVAKRTFNDLFRHFLDEQPAPNSELYCDSAVVRAKPFNFLHAIKLAKGRQNHSTIIIDQTKVTSYNGGGCIHSRSQQSSVYASPFGCPSMKTRFIQGKVLVAFNSF